MYIKRMGTNETVGFCFTTDMTSRSLKKLQLRSKCESLNKKPSVLLLPIVLKMFHQEPTVVSITHIIKEKQQFSVIFSQHESH